MNSLHYITSELPRGTLLEILKGLVEIFQENNLESVDLHFGFDWGENFKNKVIKIKPSEILAQILLAEKESIGRLAEDNLELKFSQITIRFCGDSDLHIMTEEPSELLNNILERLARLNIKYKVYPNKKS